MIFGPQSEASLQERKATIIVVALCKFGIEFQREILQSFVAPITEVSFLAFAGANGFVLVQTCPDRFWDGRFFSGVAKAKPEHRLVISICDSIQDAVYFAEVVIPIGIHDFVVTAIAVFKSDGIGMVGSVFVVGPKYDSGHRLHGRDF